MATTKKTTTKKLPFNTQSKYLIWTFSQKKRIYKHAMAIRKEVEKKRAKKNLSSAIRIDLDQFYELSSEILAQTCGMVVSNNGKTYIK